MNLASVRVERDGPVPVAYLQGEIDMANVSEISLTLFAAAPNDALGLIVDLSGVTYLDSRGLHLLFELAERLRVRDQRLHVVVPETALIRNMLKLAQFESVVPVFATVKDAIEEMV